MVLHFEKYCLLYNSGGLMPGSIVQTKGTSKIGESLLKTSLLYVRLSDFKDEQKRGDTFYSLLVTRSGG